MAHEGFIKNLQPETRPQERQAAAVAHASILTYLAGVVTGPFWFCCIFPFIPIIVLAAYAKKSKWVAFHAWQALVFQLILFLGILVVGLPAFFITFAKCAPGFGQAAGACTDSFLPFSSAVLSLIIIPFVMIIFGTIRGILLLFGKDMEYPLITRLLRSLLKPDQ